MEEKSPFSSFDELVISKQGKSFLRETAKWANFLSILGFIGVGFIVLAALGMLVFGAATTAFSSVYSGALGVGIVIVYVIIGLLYFFPLYYLNRFAFFVKSALNSNDNQKLNEALGYLKSHYKFIGVFTLVMLSIYVLFFIIGILGAGFSALS